MNLKKPIVLLASHMVIGALGFAAGIYTLPILIAPDAPSIEQIAKESKGFIYQTEFKRELTDSDALHWGEGKVLVAENVITFEGELAPGPNYKLYLSPSFVETEKEFERLKQTMVAVGDIDTFNNFIVKFGRDVTIENYNSVIVWCESFGEFITAAQYRESL